MPHSLDRRPLVLGAARCDQAPAAGRASGGGRRAARASPRRPLPGNLMMRREEVRSLDRGGDGRRWPHPQPSDPERSQRGARRGGDRGRAGRSRVDHRSSPDAVRVPKRSSRARLRGSRGRHAPAPRARRSAGDASRHRDPRLRSAAGTAADTAASQRGAIRLRALARVHRAAMASGIESRRCARPAPPEPRARLRRRGHHRRRASSQSSSAISTQTSSP